MSDILEFPHAKRVINCSREIVMLNVVTYEYLKYFDIIKRHDGSYVVRGPTGKKRLLDEFGSYNIIVYEKHVTPKDLIDLNNKRVGSGQDSL